MPTPHYSLLVALFTWFTLAHGAPSPNGPTPNTPTTPAYTPSYVARILIRIEGEVPRVKGPKCLGRDAHIARDGDPCGVFGITELPGTEQALTTSARVPIEVRNVSPGARGDTYCGLNKEGTFVCSYPRGNAKLTLEGGQMELEPVEEEGVNLMVAAGNGGYVIDISSVTADIRWNPRRGFRATIERTDESWTEPEPEPEAKGESVFSKLKFWRQSGGR